MNIWKRILQLNMRQLWRFGSFFLRHPRLILPAWKATGNTMDWSNTHFGNTHHGLNKANAFRHALWNVLLCRYLPDGIPDQRKILLVKRLTLLYERVMGNPSLDTAMDLHNNSIGRKCYLQKKEEKEAEIINFLLDLAENGQKVVKIEEIKQYPDQLIYITS